MDREQRISLVAAAFTLVCSAVSGPAAAHTPGPFGVCVPRSERAGRDIGCFIVTEHQVGRLGTAPVFWHVTRFAGRIQVEAARGADGTVLGAYGGVWLMTIGDGKWRARGGTHLATIGPLPITAGVPYAALYMEASMRPGMKSAAHRHPGPEAWYTLSGETCLETPEGAQVGHAGGPPVIVPRGLPMELTATGSAVRRSLVLILHDSSQAPASPERTWSPRGLCRR